MLQKASFAKTETRLDMKFTGERVGSAALLNQASDSFHQRGCDSRGFVSQGFWDFWPAGWIGLIACGASPTSSSPAPHRAGPSAGARWRGSMPLAGWEACGLRPCGRWHGRARQHRGGQRELDSEIWCPGSGRVCVGLGSWLQHVSASEWAVAKSQTPDHLLITVTHPI